MTSHLFMFSWDGESMVPLKGFQKRCDETFYVGERYRMEVQEERSMRSHRHYFASIHEAWLNLPEDKAERFPTSEHLRKWALIKTGYRDERSIVAASKAEAQRIAAFVRPIDEYAVVVVRDACVLVYTARSQSVKAMGKKDFTGSKEAVLDVLATLVGTSAQSLQENARTAA